MAIEKMRLVCISGNRNAIDTMILKTFSSSAFHPELASQVVSSALDGTVLSDDNKYQDYVNRVESISRALNCELHILPEEIQKKHYTDEEIEGYINSIEAKYAQLSEVLSLNQKLSKDDQFAMQQLREYDFDMINSSLYIHSNFGRFPNSSIAKLALHNNDRFIYTVLHKNNHYQWIYYITLKQDEQEIDRMFDSLYFEPISIPKLDADEVVHACELEMIQIYGFIKKKASIYKQYKYVAAFDETMMITGFIKEGDLKTFKDSFDQDESITVKDFDGKADAIKAPTILRNNWFAKPFEMFVEMYSLPKYEGFDPTFYVSITYSFLFGMMFGDLGQGIVMALLGEFLWKKKKMKLGAIMARIGVFSAIFGLVYGSLFGNEELLAQLYQSIGITALPLHVMSKTMTMPLLGAAIGLGVFLIVVSMSINVVLRLRQHEVGEALFSQNGLTGIVFYLAILIGLGAQMLYGIKLMTLPYIIGLIALPALIMMFKEPLIHLIEKVRFQPDGSIVEYFVQSFFELFEVVLSFLSNTMSFLRVGGFVMSHAGMMIVVSALMDIAGKGSIAVLIGGNIFVMCLEGLIVGIQTLRLEYYEMFSRYYDGGGRKFEAVSLNEFK